MNYISSPLLNVVASEKSARAAYIAFMNALIARQPFVCDRIFSHMEQVYLPQKGRATTRHIVAMTKDRLNPIESDPEGNHTIVELTNGWFLYTHAHPWMMSRAFIPCIEAALSLPIVAVLERDRGQNIYDEKHGAHWNISKVDHDALVALTLTSE